MCLLRRFHTRLNRSRLYIKNQLSHLSHYYSYNNNNKELPEELAKQVATLTCESSADGGICHVYLVGTYHRSKESHDKVKDVISFLKPQVVFLELCARRAGKCKFQGSEFCVAYEAATKYGGRVILGDRPVQITMRRMPLFHKAKLFLLELYMYSRCSTKMGEKFKEMDDETLAILGAQEMSKHFPTLYEVLVRERDKYMSSELLKVASEHNSVVAVVGAIHLVGIERYWKQPIQVSELLEIPSVTVVSLRFAVVGVAILCGIYLRIMY